MFIFYIFLLELNVIIGLFVFYYCRTVGKCFSQISSISMKLQIYIYFYFPPSYSVSGPSMFENLKIKTFGPYWRITILMLLLYQIHDHSL